MKMKRFSVSLWFATWGFFVDRHLNSNDHCKYVAAKATRSLNFLHIVLVQLNLLHINVLCGLLCSILVQFGSSTAKNVNTLERVQLRAASSRWNPQEILQIKKEERVRKAEEKQQSKAKAPSTIKKV